MFAVLESAVEDFQKYVLARKPSRKKLFQEAEEWFLDKDSDELFSFENIWYWYPTPVYPYPDPYTPPVVVQAAPPSPPPQPQALPPTWYYCDRPAGYYPYVPECASGWKTVPATPPPGAAAPPPPPPPYGSP